MAQRAASPDVIERAHQRLWDAQQAGIVLRDHDTATIAEWQRCRQEYMRALTAVWNMPIPAKWAYKWETLRTLDKAGGTFQEGYALGFADGYALCLDEGKEDTSS